MRAWLRFVVTLAAVWILVFGLIDWDPFRLENLIDGVVVGMIGATIVYWREIWPSLRRFAKRFARPS
jgi:hypothetical protein